MAIQTNIQWGDLHIRRTKETLGVPLLSEYLQFISLDIFLITRFLHRDWRDWFIAATVSTGVGYGLYAIAKVCVSLRRCSSYPDNIALHNSFDFASNSIST